MYERREIYEARRDDFDIFWGKTQIHKHDVDNLAINEGEQRFETEFWVYSFIKTARFGGCWWNLEAICLRNKGKAFIGFGVALHERLWLYFDRFDKLELREPDLKTLLFEIAQFGWWVDFYRINSLIDSKRVFKVSNWVKFEQAENKEKRKRKSETPWRKSSNESFNWNK